MFIELSPGPLSEPLSGRRWSPAEIRTHVQQRVSRYRRLGLSPGDRVLVLFGNRLEFFADLLALWRLGCCAVPLDSRLTDYEICVLARAAGARVALTSGEPPAALCSALGALGVALADTAASDAGDAEPAAPGPALDQDALILFTSGTTGQPKGVVHTHRSLRARWMSLRQSLGVADFSRTLCLLPTHFGHGLICNSLFPWLSGQELLIAPPFQAGLLLELGRILDEHRVTFLSSVPSVWRLALKGSRPPRSGHLKRLFCGSAPLPAHLWRGIQEWSGTREVWNAYGITETGSWAAGTSVGAFEPEDGLIGEGWGSVVKVLRARTTDTPAAESEECAPGEQGYVWLNTPALMRGYLERDDLTKEVVSEGWFLTGDIGVRDDRGWLYLKGREREEINKGGMKIHPGDVDLVAEQFEETVDVSTFACDDALYGQNVAIAVVLRSRDDETIRRLYLWVRSRLAEHQMPVRWYVLDAIPRSSRGKVNRDQLAQSCSSLTPVNMRSVLGH